MGGTLGGSGTLDYRQRNRVAANQQLEEGTGGAEGAAAVAGLVRWRRAILDYLPS